jgi:hypothetical protein
MNKKVYLIHLEQTERGFSLAKSKRRGIEDFADHVAYCNLVDVLKKLDVRYGITILEISFYILEGIICGA